MPSECEAERVRGAAGERPLSVGWRRQLPTGFPETNAVSFRGFGHSRGAEVLAFPRCGEGVNPKAHSVRFEDPAAVSAARLTDEG